MFDKYSTKYYIIESPFNIHTKDMTADVRSCINFNTGEGIQYRLLDQAVAKSHHLTVIAN